MAKYSKGGVLMVYSFPSAEEGGAEVAEDTSNLSNNSESSRDDTCKVKLSDLPENYFDDLLDIDFHSSKPNPEKRRRKEKAPDRQIQLISKIISQI